MKLYLGEKLKHDSPIRIMTKLFSRYKDTRYNLVLMLMPKIHCIIGPFNPSSNPSSNPFLLRPFVVGTHSDSIKEHNSEEETLPLEIVFCLPTSSHQDALSRAYHRLVSGCRKGLREGRRRKRQRSSRLCLRHSALSGRQRRSALLPHLNDYFGHGEG